MVPDFTTGFWLGSGLAFMIEVGDVALGRPFAMRVSDITFFNTDFISLILDIILTKL